MIFDKEYKGYYVYNIIKKMAALLNAIDAYTPVQKGENGHTEYSWSNDIQEKILQFSFQITRCDENGIELLSNKLKQILTNLKGIQLKDRQKFLELMTTMYKIIGHTRDIIDGKGEYTLAYMQILAWNEFYPDLAKFALQYFVLSPISNNSTAHPYGSWKDIKYFCNYAKEHGLAKEDQLIQFAFKLVINQLQIDMATNENKSLVAKWVPRAKSVRFGWIFNKLSVMYFTEYMMSAKTNAQRFSATKKCHTEFRKMLSKLNSDIDTVQIKQCANQWTSIDHSTTTSITISKQKKAFLNIKKDGSQRTELEDRIQCATNFSERIEKANTGEVEIKGKRIGLNDFTVQAIELIKQSRSNVNKTEIDLLNAQWRNNAKQTGSLCNMIAMVDFSGSMSGDPINCAMALGCRVAEKSSLGRRILSFSTNPTWHNLDGCIEFVDMIRSLQTGEVGYSTNFYKAFDVILESIIAKKLTPDDVKDMVLAIFSDMQITDSQTGAPKDMDVFYDIIAKKYAAVGVELYGEPFKPPHILFWNLRSTGGFPTLSSQKNVTMMSGFSPALLNTFCEKGMDALQNCSPWSILNEQLNNNRYMCLEDKLKETLIF